MDADLASIRAMPLDEVERWLTRVENGQMAGPTEVNEWLYLLITWSGNVRRLARDDERVRWARVVARVYEKLDRERESCLFTCLADQLRLRSYVIEQFGSVPDDLFFDVASVIASLRQRLPLDYDEAVQKLQRLRAAKEWGELIDDLRVLRWTKNLLGATVRLQERGYFQEAPDIERWFALREMLP